MNTAIHHVQFQIADHRGVLVNPVHRLLWLTLCNHFLCNINHTWAVEPSGRLGLGPTCSCVPEPWYLWMPTEEREMESALVFLAGLVRSDIGRMICSTPPTIVLNHEYDAAVRQLQLSISSSFWPLDPARVTFSTQLENATVDRIVFSQNSSGNHLYVQSIRARFIAREELTQRAHGQDPDAVLR